MAHSAAARKDIAKALRYVIINVMWCIASGADDASLNIILASQQAVIITIFDTNQQK